MSGLRAAIVLAILAVLIYGVAGTRKPSDSARQPHYGPATSSSPASTSSTGPSSDDKDEPQPSSLERAHWCRLDNGTFLPLNHTYMRAACSMCQCTNTRAIRCRVLQCLPTYCIDNSMPSRKEGQCCAQCAYEKVSDACVYNNVAFPHGAVIKNTDTQMQCWCQLGNIECRNHIGSLFEGIDIFADPTAIYIILTIIFMVVMFGLLVCCGCTTAFYFYYQRNQEAFQQAYDEYINGAGWEPVNEEVDADAVAAEEKRMEAEGYQLTDDATEESVPPPYALYNGAYVSEEEKKVAL